MRFPRRDLLAIAVALISSACNKSQGAGGVDASGPRIHIVGKTIVTSSGASLAGVAVCVYERGDIPCATSGPNGDFDVEVPASSEVGVTFGLIGYVPVLMPLVTPATSIKGFGVSLPEVQGHTVLYQAFGATCPDTATGFLAAFASTSTSQLGARNIQMTLEPMSGKGPFYLADDGSPAPTATATSAFSVGMFANLKPGVATVTLTRPGSMVCKPSFGGWPSPTPNSVRVPIAAGVETHVAMSCTE